MSICLPVSEDRAEISVRGTLVNRDVRRAVLSWRRGAGYRWEDRSQSLRSVRIDADGAFAFKERLQLEKPQLWSPDSPYLYSVKFL
mgnify:CR=1 FL=1